MNKPCISIIIPTFNEAYFIGKLIDHLWKSDTENWIKEILVADAGSEDQTCQLAQAYGAKVIHCPSKGRSSQMNFAAKQATGEILHFIHADSFPPHSFSSAIIQHIKQHRVGCFRSLFDTSSRFLRFNSFFTRFSCTVFRGGGQTLFVERKLFEQLGGYREDMELMEEYDLIVRLKKQAKFKVIQRNVLVSARDYEKHGNWNLQARYMVLVMLFFSGVPHRFLQQAHAFLCPWKRAAKQKNHTPSNA